MYLKEKLRLNSMIFDKILFVGDESFIFELWPNSRTKLLLLYKVINQGEDTHTFIW